MCVERLRMRQLLGIRWIDWQKLNASPVPSYSVWIEAARTPVYDKIRIKLYMRIWPYMGVRADTIEQKYRSLYGRLGIDRQTDDVKTSTSANGEISSQILFITRSM